jgi:hypothetical protein
VPNSIENENGDPFKPRKLERSLIASGRREVDAGSESEDSDVVFGVGVGAQSTPVATRNAKEREASTKRAVEQNTHKILSKRMPARSEAEDSAKEDVDAQSSEVEGEEIVFTVEVMKGFTRALLGAVQMMKSWIRKLNLDKEKNDGIAVMNKVIRGIVASMEQCIDQRRRRKIIKKDHTRFEEARRTTMKQTVSGAVNEGREDRNEGAMGDQSKRKMESPGVGRKEFATKSARKGELTYAETCRREVYINATEGEREGR